MPLTARHLAVVGLGLVACGPPMPEGTPANQPVRILAHSQRPAQREFIARLGPNCPDGDRDFSVRVSDPDVDDVIRATWFIDPNERFVATPTAPVFQGNPGTLIPGSDVRIVSSPTVLGAALATIADGRRHRVEVVVTDGEFIEGVALDPSTGEPRPFLELTRAPVRSASGPVFPLEAFRDDTVWLVEVSTTPCQ
jgi:hypothetical protein